jgi:hypothetical protein
VRQRQRRRSPGFAGLRDGPATTCRRYRHVLPPPSLPDTPASSPRTAVRQNPMHSRPVPWLRLRLSGARRRGTLLGQPRCQGPPLATRQAKAAHSDPSRAASPSTPPSTTCEPHAERNQKARLPSSDFPQPGKACLDDPCLGRNGRLCRGLGPGGPCALAHRRRRMPCARCGFDEPGSHGPHWPAM